MKKRMATILRRAANRLDPSLVMTVKLDDADFEEIKTIVDSQIREALASCGGSPAMMVAMHHNLSRLPILFRSE